MPTGYTARLMEKGQEFPEFVMGCARAFGALITLRDDPADASIPQKFEPSAYYQEQRVTAEKELADLTAMLPEEAAAYGEAEKDRAIKSQAAWIKKAVKENERLLTLCKQIKAWRPPTPEHEGLKGFMLDQIRASMNDTSYAESRLRDLYEKASIGFYNEAVANAKRGIVDYAKSDAEERERCAGRTEWLQQLRDSLRTS